MKNYLAALSFALVLVTQITTGYADTGAAVDGLSTEWAHITYETPAAEHKTLLKTLYLRAQNEVAEDNGNADLLAWAGIVTSSYAGARGGMGALKIAKQARKYFEQAMEIDPEALDGGARTSLGVLYYQVPSWPIGFGKDKVARELLAESYQKHPDNIDVLYFYADFLEKKKQTEDAADIFNQALALPASSPAEIGRHQQIKEQLAKMS